METLVASKVSVVLRLNFNMEQIDNQSETWERIRDEAGVLFMRYGIRSVSMDDIAVSMGISKKTIYQHFKDKDELVEAIIVMRNRQIQEDCLSSRAAAINAVEEVFLTMDRITAHMGSVNPALLYDLHKFHFGAYQKFQEIRQQFLFQVTRNNMERGIQEGLYREDVDLDVLSKFRLESMMAPFNMELYPASKYNILDVTRTILEHWIYGLVTPKGYELITLYKQQRHNTSKYEKR
jgi:AcrR family transcriptional regulator